MTILFAPATKANSQPAKNASYSASLFDEGKSNFIAYSNLSPWGLSRATPAPLPVDVDDRSTYTLHVGVEILASSYANSTTKSANTYALIAGLGWNSIPYSLNSTAHLTILPESFGLAKSCFKGWLVKMVTW
ncbi:hypothetical protein Sango_3105700 [Sesamum angolense]|uniref:Uncharacterized protein n=1 Tax=Sesamum angolense TaxID=2727404 RepID=A0AAE1T9H8_9LAMI|nr:hypothetical protein Sango_3105700 [Sesamum angolense]